MIDFHAHLDLYPDPDSVVRRCSELGVYVLSVTTSPSAWDRTSALASGFPRIRTALGLHPQLAQQRKQELSLFREVIGKTQYMVRLVWMAVASASRSGMTRWMFFTRSLEQCSRYGGRILSIHSRRAASEVLGSLRVYPLGWCSDSSLVHRH